MKEVDVIAEAVGHTLDNLDFVLDAFDETGSQWPAAVGKDAADEGHEPFSELL